MKDQFGKIKPIKIKEDRKFEINGRTYDPSSREGIEGLIILINELIDIINTKIK